MKSAGSRALSTSRPTERSLPRKRVRRTSAMSCCAVGWTAFRCTRQTSWRSTSSICSTISLVHFIVAAFATTICTRSKIFSCKMTAIPRSSTFSWRVFILSRGSDSRNERRKTCGTFRSTGAVTRAMGGDRLPHRKARVTGFSGALSLESGGELGNRSTIPWSTD